MSRIDMFQNVMILFWILVQQICLCCVKWTYEDLIGRLAAARKHVMMHATLFPLFVLLAFDTLLAVDLVYGRFPVAVLPFYPRLRWNFFCTVMLVLDALLVAYGWRIYRLYMHMEDSSQARPSSVRLQDLALSGAFLVPFALYHWGMAQTALRHRLSFEAIWALQFFFIKIANFFYAVFEGTAAVLLWKIYLKIREGELLNGRIERI